MPSPDRADDLAQASLAVVLQRPSTWRVAPAKTSPGTWWPRPG